MSNIRVDNIKVTDFKNISDIDLNLSKITALVGGNTSGKSSILQAAQLGVSLFQASFQSVGRRGDVRYLSTLANEGVSYRPTEYLLDLRRGGPATQDKGYEIGFSCTMIHEGGSEEEKSISIKILRGKNANLSLIFSGDKYLIQGIGNPKRPFSILTPGLSGIPLREEWRTRGALDAAAMHGDANLYLRTLLDHLFQTLNVEMKRKWLGDEVGIEDLSEELPWRKFSVLLDKCYPGARVYVNHNSDKDRYVNVEVWYQENYSTIDMASTGMLQVIQILAYACFYNPPLLLLDEPDAHLHADSQTRLYEALRGVVDSTDTRIIFATHSPQLIQLMLSDTDASVVWMEGGSRVDVNGEGLPALPILMQLGALTVGAEVFSPNNKIILLTEDKDTKPIRALAEANGAFNYACLSYNGCENLNGARHLARLLTELRPEVRVIIHRDKDFRKTEEMNFEMALFNGKPENNRIKEIFTPLNDVESSFLQIEHLIEVFKESIKRENLERILENAISICRDDVIVAIERGRRVIDRRLYDAKRLKANKDLRETHSVPQKAPSLKEFTPADGRTPLKLEQCHGKTVFRFLKGSLHKEIRGDSKNIEKMLLTPTMHLRCAEWDGVFDV